jgi:hypothetical protein
LKPACADWHWRFTTEGVIENSAGENYLTQTNLLAKYLAEQVCAEQVLPKVYEDAIEEFKRREEELVKLMDEDWKKAAEELAGLQLNQLCRETPDQVLWDVILHNKVNGGYLLQGMYTWTNQRSAHGDLVYVGRAVDGGVDVVSCGPRISLGSLGVRFSRRVQSLAG